jgi:hypothetical protein
MREIEMSSVTFATKAEEDSDLVKQFKKYKQENSMNSKSEAIRSLMRAGLEEEYQDDSDSQDDEPSQVGTPLQDALIQAGLLDRRFFGYAIFGFVVNDIYDLMASVGTYFVSLGTVNTIFTVFALLIVAMFTVDYVIKPLASTLQDNPQDERRSAQGAD